MTCPNCEAASRNSTWGGYDFACVQCCARLIVSAHPDKRQAQVLMDAIQAHPGRPQRSEIYALAKSMLEPTLSPPKPAQESLL